MDPESSLPNSQEPATFSYPETNIKLYEAKALFFHALQILQTMTQDICSGISANFLSRNVV